METKERHKFKIILSNLVTAVNGYTCFIPLTVLNKQKILHNMFFDLKILYFIYQTRLNCTTSVVRDITVQRSPYLNILISIDRPRGSLFISVARV